MKSTFAAGIIGIALLGLQLGCAAKKDSSSTDPAIPTVGAFSVASKTATAFTVNWAAGSDDKTAASDLKYKLVYATTAYKVATAADADLLGTIVVDWTANITTGSLSSLTNSTTYYVAVLVKDLDNNIGFAADAVVTLCAGKRMYLATAPNGNFGGKTGADGICTTQKPAGLGTVKAMVSDNTGIASHIPNSNSRQACYGNCNNVNTYTGDWVFAANSNFCTTDYSARVATTSGVGLAPQIAVGGLLGSTAQTVFAGFDIYFGNGDSAGNCNNWSTTSSTFNAGLSTSTYGNGTGFIIGRGIQSCSTAGVLVCVEQ